MSKSDPLVRAIEAAKAKGLVVVHPGPCELFIDIDDWQSLRRFQAQWGIVKDQIGGSYEVRSSPSRKAHRHHVYVTLDRPVVDNAERIMLQALLGSDLLHEVLSWLSHVRGETAPTLFFERPEDVRTTSVDDEICF